MERIQAALKKAREARTEGTDNKKAPAQPAETRRGKDAEPLVLRDQLPVETRDEVWKSIKTFQPDERLLDRNRVVAYRACNESVPYDVMRTKLLQKLQRNNWSRLAITSPASSAGKTTTALNLAFSTARNSAVRVMVIELDMRKPTLASIVGLHDDCQFSRALAGDEDPELHLRRFGRNVIFGTNKSATRNPAELLQGTKAAGVIDELEAKFRPDVIIFDTPPLLAGDDTMAFLDLFDFALLIVESEKSTVEEIDKSEQELSARTNLLGVTLNKCRYLSRHEDYGKEYGY